MGVVGCTRVRVMDCMYVLSINNCKMDETINEQATVKDGIKDMLGRYECLVTFDFADAAFLQLLALVYIGLLTLKYESVIRVIL